MSKEKIHIHIWRPKNQKQTGHVAIETFTNNGLNSIYFSEEEYVFKKPGEEGIYVSFWSEENAGMKGCVCNQLQCPHFHSKYWDLKAEGGKGEEYALADFDAVVVNRKFSELYPKIAKWTLLPYLKFFLTGSKNEYNCTTLVLDLLKAADSRNQISLMDRHFWPTAIFGFSTFFSLRAYNYFGKFVMSNDGKSKTNAIIGVALFLTLPRALYLVGRSAQVITVMTPVDTIKVTSGTRINSGSEDENIQSFNSAPSN